MSKFFSGFLWGSLAGGVLGLLYAPRSGTKTRSILKKQLQEALSTVQEVATNKQKVQHNLEHLTTEGVRIAQQFIREFNETVETFHTETQPTLDRIERKTAKLKQDLGANKPDDLEDDLVK